MDLTKDALALLLGTGQKAADPKPLPIANPRTAYVWLGDELREIQLPPAPRQHSVRSLEDLANYALALAEGKHLPCLPVIWHNTTEVVLMCHDEDRRDRVTFKLDPSQQFTSLMRLADEPHSYFQQREFLQLLRLKLGVDPATINQFRRLDWKSSSEIHGVVERGRESLGKSVEAEILGMAELPETLDVEFAIYETVGEDRLYRLRCLLDFDATNARMTIVPQPGELQHALNVHQVDIENRLAALLDDAAVPVYYGSP